MVNPGSQSLDSVFMHDPGGEKTTIDAEDMARDITCLLAGQEYRAKGRLVRGSIAIQRDPRAVYAACFCGMHARD